VVWWAVRRLLMRAVVGTIEKYQNLYHIQKQWAIGHVGPQRSNSTTLLPPSSPPFAHVPTAMRALTHSFNDAGTLCT
jgi:hypothetical protein